MSPIELKEILSKNLKKFRKEIGLSQFALAERANLSEDTIKSIEVMRQWPSEKTLAQIAEALEIDVFQLFLPERNFLLESKSQSSELRKQIAQHLIDYLNSVINEL